MMSKPTNIFVIRVKSKYFFNREIAMKFHCIIESSCDHIYWKTDLVMLFCDNFEIRHLQTTIDFDSNTWEEHVVFVTISSICEGKLHCIVMSPVWAGVGDDGCQKMQVIVTEHKLIGQQFCFWWFLASSPIVRLLVWLCNNGFIHVFLKAIV